MKISKLLCLFSFLFYLGIIFTLEQNLFSTEATTQIDSIDSVQSDAFSFSNTESSGVAGLTENYTAKPLERGHSLSSKNLFAIKNVFLYAFTPDKSGLAYLKSSRLITLNLPFFLIASPYYHFT